MRRDGTSIPIMVTDTPVYDADGRLTAILGISSDISERIRDDQFRTRLAAVVTSTDDAILTTTLDGTVTTWNDGAERLFGYAAQEIVGRSMHVLAPDELQDELRSVLAMVAEGGSIRDQDTRRVRRDGSEVEVSQTLSPIRDRTGQVVEVSSIIRDMTERRAAQVEIEHRSLHDPLTGLPNRTLLLRRLASELGPTHDPGRPTAVAFLDIDRFNVVNDSLGHLVGDQVLDAVGARLAGAAAEGDTVARLGGDEFVVVRPGCSDHDATA